MEHINRWVPTSSAMATLGVTRQRVYQLIREGLLVARQEGATWLISQHSVDARIAGLKDDGETE